MIRPSALMTSAVFTSLVTSTTVARSRVHSSSVIGRSLMMYLPSELGRHTHHGGSQMANQPWPLMQPRLIRLRRPYARSVQLAISSAAQQRSLPSSASS